MLHMSIPLPCSSGSSAASSFPHGLPSRGAGTVTGGGRVGGRLGGGLRGGATRGSLVASLMTTKFPLLTLSYTDELVFEP
ncbi:hypothetical protein AKJ16_DCAP14578 [Drosera capensis]